MISATDAGELLPRGFNDSPLRMPDVPVAGPVLEKHAMSNSPLAQVLGERLVNAREAALA